MEGIKMSGVGKRTFCLSIITIIISIIVSLSCLTGTALAETEVQGGTSVTLRGDVVPVTTHTVTFVDRDGTVIDTQIIEHGSSATAPTPPSHDGYTFDRWDRDFSNVTGDLVVVAQYKINSYTVIFKDHDGTELNRQTVEWQKGAKAPNEPTREGYRFIGWDEDFSKITGDLTVTAKYEKIVEPQPPTPNGGGGATGGTPQTGDLNEIMPYIISSVVLLIIVGTCSWVLLKRKKGEGDEE